MKIVTDETPPDQSAAREAAWTEDTQISPGLRPEVLSDPEQRRTKSSVRAALFGGEEAQTIGRYRVLNRLGEGGMGVVYAAYDEQLGRKVALKLLRGARVHSARGRERTIREARALARLSHPNVVHVYEVGEAEGEVFVAMEFLTGPTLKAWLTARRRPWREVLAVFRQAAEGLSAAHRHGVIHRDFKPANVIVGDDGRVRVLDFGLAHFDDAAASDEPLSALALPGAKRADELLTQTGAVLGTPAYMAAEQFAGGRGDAQADQFSFCTALYEALHGRRPFEGDSLEALAAVVSAGPVAAPPSGSDAPAWLHRVVVRGLQPDPARRWPSMDALLAALTPDTRRRSSLRVATVAASLASAAVGVTWLVMPDATAELAGERENSSRALVVAAHGAQAGDPVAAVAAVANLEGDDPATLAKAQFVSSVAETLPAQILHAGAAPLVDVVPLADGRLIGRDELGAVWQWQQASETATEVLPAGAATKLLVAGDAPVWVAIGDRVRVFAAGATQPTEIELGGLEPKMYTWRLASDGRTLAAAGAMLNMVTPTREAVRLWDLSAPAAAPRVIAVADDATRVAVALADEALVAISEPAGTSLLRPGETSAELLPQVGVALAFSADRGYLVAQAKDSDNHLDVHDLTSGTSRRVEAEGVLALTGSDVLFARTGKQRAVFWRESLATGEVLWTRGLGVETSASAMLGSLKIDARRARFAAPLKGTGSWAVGDLASGELRSFLAAPEDSAMRWLGDARLVHPAGATARVFAPDAAPLQVRHQGKPCALSPAARYGVVSRGPLADGAFARVELATGAVTEFRCPSGPPPRRLGKRELTRVSSAVDDAGTVMLTGVAGWSCWWDPATGARAGNLPFAPSFAALPQGVVLGTDAGEVQVWREPTAMARSWALGEAVGELEVSPSGEHVVARTMTGLQLLHLLTGTATPLVPGGSSAGEIDPLGGAVGWSHDSARLAVLSRVGASLVLDVFAVDGEKVGAPVHREFADAPGMSSNSIGFTPSDAALAFTDHDGSVTLLDLAAGTRSSVAVPGPLFALHMLGETKAFGVDTRGAPLLADFAAKQASMLAPDVSSGFSSGPELRTSADGSLWTCDALGLGTLAQLSPEPATPPAAGQ